MASNLTNTLTTGLRHLEGPWHRFSCMGVGELRRGAVQTTDGKGGSHPPRHCEGKTRSLSPLGNGVDSHRRIWVSSRRRGGSSVWPVEGSQSVWEVMLTGRGKKECCQGHGGEEEIHICPLRHRWCRPPRMNRSGTASSQLGLVDESRKWGKGGGGREGGQTCRSMRESGVVF